MEVKKGPCLCGQPERMEEVDGKPILVRCPLYQKLYVNEMVNGKLEKVEEWKCSIAWLPILMIELAGETKAVASYTEDFRNQMVARIDHAREHALEVHGPEVITLEAQDAPAE